MRDRNIRAAKSAAPLRTNIEPDTSPDVVPDGYARPLAALRAANGRTDTTAAQLRAMANFRNAFFDTASVSRAAAGAPSTSSVHLNPPSPYGDDVLKRFRETYYR